MSDKNNKVLASPKTRKFARELGVNINKISGSKSIDCNCNNNELYNQ